LARHDSSGQLNLAVIRQKMASATENADMHASSGPDRMVHSNTDRRLLALRPGQGKLHSVGRSLARRGIPVRVRVDRLWCQVALAALKPDSAQPRPARYQQHAR
jgi:hypothetical protein